VLVEDARGGIAWRGRIDPYGRMTVEPGATVDVPLRWPGHYFDEATGLHYNRFRYYSPELGRYLQSDPVGIGAGLNLYAYPANPLVVVDVRGEACPQCEARIAQAKQDQADIAAGRVPRVAAADDSPESAASRRRIASAAGMEEQHLRRLQEFSQAETAAGRPTTIVVRDTNPATPHHVNEAREGRLNARPKGHDVLMKTDPETGLVTQRPNTDEALAQRSEGERRTITENRDGLMGDGTPENRGKGWTYDDDGNLRDPQNAARFGDHDLQGVYQRQPDGTQTSPFGRMTNDPNAHSPPQDQAYVDRLNNATGGTTPQTQMYQHGPNDNYIDSRTGRAALPPAENANFTVVHPDGSAERMTTPQLRQHYADNNIPWPY
jgi:RHS repeat-associated protein